MPTNSRSGKAFEFRDHQVSYFQENGYGRKIGQKAHCRTLANSMECFLGPTELKTDKMYFQKQMKCISCECHWIIYGLIFYICSLVLGTSKESDFRGHMNMKYATVANFLAASLICQLLIQQQIHILPLATFQLLMGKYDEISRHRFGFSTFAKN